VPIIRVTLEGEAGCRVEHLPSGTRLDVRTPPEYGGPGGAFSATDLLAAALASCIATSLAPVASRHGIRPEWLSLLVEKELSNAPKRVARMTVIVRIPRAIDPILLRKLERAAASCAVHRSLADDVAVEVRFEGGDAGRS
jgi:uncharacterized OsmC-like protein